LTSQPFIIKFLAVWTFPVTSSRRADAIQARGLNETLNTRIYQLLHILSQDSFKMVIHLEDDLDLFPEQILAVALLS
jgi:hypothetical protein